MIQIQFKVFIAISLLLMVGVLSCNQAPIHEEINHKDNAFAVSEQGKDSHIEFPYQTESWQIIGDDIVAKSSDSDSLYIMISCSELRSKGVFGKLGHGPNEFISPQLFSGKDNEPMIIDNGNKKIYNYANSEISQIGTLQSKDAVNDIKTLSYPIVAYSTITPNEQCFKIIDITTGKQADSIAFVDNSNKGKSSLYEFAWNRHENKIVIAHMYSDKFIVCETDDRGKLIKKKSFQTDGKFSNEKMYFSDVACGDYIYLLSQKEVDLNNFTGHSDIEIYDYDGKPIKKISLNYISDKMLLDNSNHRLLLTSVSDEYLHSISL